MEYLSELPEISSSSVGKGIIELEVEGEVARLPDDVHEEVVFIGSMEGTIHVVAGKVVSYEFIKAEEAASGNSFTRLEIEGECITFTHQQK